MAYSRTTYTGPVKNRGEDDQRRALVSREELADFRRKYGADKTLRDLLNADRSGKLPEVSSERDMRARGVQGANISPAKDEGAPASRPRASLSDIPGLIARGMSEGADRVPAGRGLGAAFVGAGAGSAARTAMAGAKAARDWRDTPPAGADPSKWQAIVRQIDEKYPGGATPSGGMSKEALAKELAKDMSSGSIGRGTPMRSTATTSDTGRRFTPAEEMEAVTSAARGAAGRKAVQEARTGRSQAAAEAKAEKPILRTDKSSETPRSRTRDEEDVDFKKGGKVQAYAKGGSVRGAGIAQRGVRQCKVC